MVRGNTLIKVARTQCVNGKLMSNSKTEKTEKLDNDRPPVRNRNLLS